MPEAAGYLQLAAAAGLGAAAALAGYWILHKTQGTRASQAKIRHGLLGLIGNTPLLRIESLSRETGCEILAKAELLNPGGSIKDRVAAEIMTEALVSGRLAPGGIISEGTAGSTGISLALCARASGCSAFVAMPDDAALEKSELLRTLGAEVRRVRPVSITHPDHFVNVARRRAEEQNWEATGCDNSMTTEHHNGAAVDDLAASTTTALFADQFENLANFRAHLRTGREILDQTDGRLDAFVCGAGTGGTIAGISSALKAVLPKVRVFLIDPPGSSLFNKVTRGVMFTRHEAEGTRLRNPADTITEGIGINRLTANFARAKIDGAFQGTDREAVEMAAYLLRNDGLFVGSSSAMNCVGAVKAARLLGPGHTIVTILCDGGARHLSRFHSSAYLEDQGLAPTAQGRQLDIVVAGPYKPAQKSTIE